MSKTWDRSHRSNASKTRKHLKGSNSLGKLRYAHLEEGVPAKVYKQRQIEVDTNGDRN